MKIKKPAAPAGQEGGAAIASRFRLEADPEAARKAEKAAKHVPPSKAAVTVCLIAALITSAVAGALVMLKYVEWDNIWPR